MRVGDLVEYAPYANQHFRTLGLVVDLDTQGSEDVSYHLADVQWLDGADPTWCRIANLRVIGEAEQ